MNWDEPIKSPVMKVKITEPDAIETIEKLNETISKLKRTINYWRTKAMGYIEKNNQPPSEEIYFEVARNVCDFYGITLDELNSYKRTDKLVKPRHVICYILKEASSLKLSAIGRLLGDRHHSTVIHGHRNIENAISVKDIDRSEVEFINGIINTLMDNNKLI